VKDGQQALLRHARRAFRQNLGRSLLIVVVIALPIGLAITVASAQRSLAVSNQQQAEWTYGNAVAVLGVNGYAAGPLEAVAVPVGPPPEVPTLPASDDVLPVYRGGVSFGRQGASLVATDMAHPLYAPVFSDLVGVVPREAGDVALSRPLAKRQGLSIGDIWDIPGVGERRLVATYVLSKSKGEYAAALPLADPAVGLGLGPTGFGLRVRPDYLLTAAGERSAPELDGYTLGPAQLWWADGDGEGAVLAVDKPPVLASFVSIGLLIEAGLVASAAYATGVRRRIRELGLLASIGATPSQVQRAVVSESVVVAAVAVPFGLVLGIAGSFATLPLVRRIPEHVVDGVGVRGTDLIGPAMVGAIATVLAAWIPARMAGRVPVLTAMAGRVPSRAVRGRAVPVGFAALGLGALGVFLSGELARGEGSESTAVILLALSILVTLGGAAAIGTWVMGRVAAKADRLPVLARLVARDGGRQQVRSAVVVGALVVVAAIPMAVGVLAATFDAQEEASFVPAALLDEVWISRVDEPRLDVAGPALEPVPDEAIQLVANEVSVLQINRLQTVGFEYEEATTSGAYVYREPSYLFNENGHGGKVALGTIEAVKGLRLGGQEAAVLSALDAGNVVGLTRGSVEGRRVEITLGYPESEEGNPRDYAVAVPATEIAVRPAAWAAPTYLMPVDVAGELGLVVVEEMAVMILDAPIPESNRHALENVLSNNERFGQAQFPLYSLVIGEERTSVAGRVQWIAVAVALGIALVIGGCTTALAAAESDRDVLTMVSVGGAPSLRKRFLGLQSAYHAAIGTALALPVVALLLWALYRGEEAEDVVGLVFPTLPLLAVIVGIRWPRCAPPACS